MLINYATIGITDPEIRYEHSSTVNTNFGPTGCIIFFNHRCIFALILYLEPQCFSIGHLNISTYNLNIKI